LFNRRVQFFESGFHVLADVDAQSSAATFSEHGKISACLRCFDYTERVLLAGNGEIVRVVTSDLQEDAGIGAAFIGLAGGMEKARAES
jgi:hypothetical protein